MANLFNINRIAASTANNSNGVNTVQKINFTTNNADTRTAEERSALAAEVMNLQLPQGKIVLFDDFVQDDEGRFERDETGRLWIKWFDQDLKKLIANPAVVFTAYGASYIRRDLETFNAKVLKSANRLMMEELGRALRITETHEIFKTAADDINEFPQLQGADRVFTALNNETGAFQFIRFDGLFSTVYQPQNDLDRDVTGALWSRGQVLRLGRGMDSLKDRVDEFNEWLRGQNFNEVKYVLSKWELAAFIQEGFSIVIPTVPQEVTAEEDGKPVTRRETVEEMMARVQNGTAETKGKLQHIARGYQGQRAQELGLRRQDFLNAQNGE